jgi:hypothetical protein
MRAISRRLAPLAAVGGDLSIVQPVAEARGASPASRDAGSEGDHRLRIVLGCSQRLSHYLACGIGWHLPQFGSVLSAHRVDPGTQPSQLSQKLLLDNQILIQVGEPLEHQTLSIAALQRGDRFHQAEPLLYASGRAILEKRNDLMPPRLGPLANCLPLDVGIRQPHKLALRPVTGLTQVRDYLGHLSMAAASSDPPSP